MKTSMRSIDLVIASLGIIVFYQVLEKGLGLWGFLVEGFPIAGTIYYYFPLLAFLTAVVALIRGIKEKNRVSIILSLLLVAMIFMAFQYIFGLHSLYGSRF